MFDSKKTEVAPISKIIGLRTAGTLIIYMSVILIISKLIKDALISCAC